MKLVVPLVLIMGFVGSDPIQNNLEAAGDLFYLRQNVFPSSIPPAPQSRIPPPPPPPPMSQHRIPPAPALPPLAVAVEQTYAPDGRSDLLGQIREGKKLKTARMVEKPMGGAQNDLQSALSSRRKHLVDTDSDEDDDWSD